MKVICMASTMTVNSDPKAGEERLVGLGEASPEELEKAPTSGGSEGLRPEVLVPQPKGVGGAYARFLELPVPIVLSVLWLAGVVLIGLCVLALYWAAGGF